MKDTLRPGFTFEFRYRIPASKMVPRLYPESEAFQRMPEVLATGFMVGLLEWACIEALNPHLDWPREQSVGTHINVSHLAATPAGLTVTVNVRLDRMDGSRVYFAVSAHDGVDKITEGTHERVIIDAARFCARVAGKARMAAVNDQGRA